MLGSIKQRNSNLICILKIEHETTKEKTFFMMKRKLREQILQENKRDSDKGIKYKNSKSDTERTTLISRTSNEQEDKKNKLFYLITT